MDDVDKQVEYFPMLLGRIGDDPEFEPIQFLRDLHEEKLFILSIFGPKNTGKSYLLNHLIPENKYKRFTVNLGKEEEETKAIWIYNTKLTIGNKEVVIIDCEGLLMEDADSLSGDDLFLNHKYFQTLALISSMVIFNCLYAFEDMEEYVKKYTKVFNDCTDYLFANLSTEKISDCANFIWVNRDIDDESDMENFEKFFKEEMKDNILYKNNKIISIFNLPAPMGFAEFQDYQNCNSELECDVEMTNEMNPLPSDEFKEKFEKLKDFISDKIEIKTYSGVQAFGEAYSVMLQDYYDNLAKDNNNKEDPPYFFRCFLNNNLKAITDEATDNTIPSEIRNKEKNPKFEYKDIFELLEKSKEIFDKIAAKYLTTYIAKQTKQNNIELLTEEFKKLYLSTKTAIKNKYISEKNNLKNKIETYKNNKDVNSDFYLSFIESENFIFDFINSIKSEVGGLFKDDYFGFDDIFNKHLLPCILEKIHKAFTALEQVKNNKIADLNEKVLKRDQTIQTKEDEQLELEKKNIELEKKNTELDEKFKEEKKQLEDKIYSLEQAKANMEDIFNKTKEDKEKTIHDLKQQIKELNHKITEMSLSSKENKKDLFFDNTFLEKNAKKTLSLKTMYLQSKVAVNEFVEKVDSFVNNKDLFIQSCFAEDSNREINENSTELFEASIKYIKEKNDLRMKKLNEEKETYYKLYLENYQKYADLNFEFKRLESQKKLLDDNIKNLEKDKEMLKTDNANLNKRISFLNSNLEKTEQENKESKDQISQIVKLTEQKCYFAAKNEQIEFSIQELYYSDDPNHDYKKFLDAINPLDKEMQVMFIEMYIKMHKPKKKIADELTALKEELLKEDN